MYLSSESHYIGIDFINMPLSGLDSQISWSLFKQEWISPKAKKGEHIHEPGTSHAAFYTLFGAAESNPRLFILLVFGSCQEWRMLQSNQIWIKQLLPSQCDTVDFKPLSSDSCRGQFKVRIQFLKNALSLRKPIINLIYSFLVAVITLHLPKYLPDHQFVLFKIHCN